MEIYAPGAIMDFKRLQHALLLAEERNFSRAAKRANLSQTAFSRSIQALEGELGCKLFDRDTRSVALTLVGKRFLARGTKLLADANDIAREMSLLTLVEAGDLSFGVSPMAMTPRLRHSIVELRQRHPKLHLNVEVASWGRLRKQLEDERIEFFVAFSEILAKHEALSVTPLSPIRASLFCRAGHPLVINRSAVASQALMDYPWAAVEMSAEFLPRFRSWCVPEDRAARPLVLACSSLDLLRDVVLGTDTLIWSWHHWLDRDLEAGHLIDVGMLLSPAIEANGVPTIGRGIVQLAERTCSPAAHMAIQAITDGCNDQEPE